MNGYITLAKLCKLNSFMVSRSSKSEWKTEFQKQTEDVYIYIFFFFSSNKIDLLGNRLEWIDIYFVYVMVETKRFEDEPVISEEQMDFHG